MAKFSKAQWLETIKYPWRSYKDDDLRRQFKHLATLGTAALPEDKYEKVSRIVHKFASKIPQNLNNIFP